MKISGQRLLALNNKYCAKYNFPSNLVAAVTLVESMGEIYATRFEPKFYTKVDIETLSGYVPAPIPTESTERVLRATSFGLMQILGETARTIGKFQGNFLTDLFDPETNIEICSFVLNHYIQRYGIEAGIGKYNGAGAPYFNKVQNILNNNLHVRYYNGQL